MKLTIKEIKEKCETDDKVNFKGIVDKVWGFNDKPSKYSIGTQNIIIKDDTDKIKVIFSKIKKPEDVYKEDIEGKEVEVSGKVSIYNEEVNIFGDLKSKEEKEPKDQGGAVATSIGELRVARQPGLTRPEVRLKCLFLAKEVFVSTELKTKIQDLINAARILEEYVCKGTVAAAARGAKRKEQEQPDDGPRESEEEEKEEPKTKLSPEKVKQINMLMALAENRGEEGKNYLNDLIVLKGYKSIKEFLDEDIKEANKELEEMGSDDVPF